MKNKICVHIYCDKIRSIHNVGSIFRTSEGFGFIEKIYLGNYTPTPLHPKMKKTALGAEEVLNWETIKQPKRLIQKLKEDEFEIVVLDKFKELKIRKLKTKNQKLKILNIYDYKPKAKILLIVGNEVDGVSENILNLADVILEIPMNGRVKESLNVSVAFGIGVYSLINNL